MIARTESILPATTTKVERSTSREINERIERETIERIARVSAEGPPAIEARLNELDREWDIERVLEANAATLSLLSLALGRGVNRLWFGFTGVIAAFLLQHALQGWCPPVPIFRRRGVRTAREIELERTALRILRGDFRSGSHTAVAAFAEAKGSTPEMQQPGRS